MSKQQQLPARLHIIQKQITPEVHVDMECSYYQPDEGCSVFAIRL